MGGEWRWNKTSWMNTGVMKQWLYAFYQHIGTERRVVLLMDNFSAHSSAIEEMPPLANIRIAWLPLNATSRYQPLDHGIIQSFKAHYRRQWLSYMLDEYEHGRNPINTMTLALAIRWTLRSWYQYVNSSTISNCFRKSTVLNKPLLTTTNIQPLDLPQLYQQVQQAGNIHDAMDLANFLNQIEEQEVGGKGTQTEEQILQEVIDEHIEEALGFSVTDQDADNENQPERPIYTIQDARQAVQVLIDFAETQDDLSTAHSRAMERIEQELERVTISSRRQLTLDRWIT
jgi:hypothetical protein